MLLQLNLCLLTWTKAILVLHRSNIREWRIANKDAVGGGGLSARAPWTKNSLNFMRDLIWRTWGWCLLLMRPFTGPGSASELYSILGDLEAFAWIAIRNLFVRLLRSPWQLCLELEGIRSLWFPTLRRIHIGFNLKMSHFISRSIHYVLCKTYLQRLIQRLFLHLHIFFWDGRLFSFLCESHLQKLWVKWSGPLSCKAMNGWILSMWPWRMESETKGTMTYVYTGFQENKLAFCSGFANPLNNIKRLLIMVVYKFTWCCSTAASDDGKLPAQSSLTQQLCV